MSLGNVARVTAVLAAVVAAAGSATSSSNQNASMMQQNAQNTSAPPPQQMEGARALGLWQTNFGAVKIEADNSKGGLAAGAVQGVWVYQRQGAEVVGYFSGNLRGNVLDFRWQEPNNPPLTGAGFLVFDPQGRQYSGRWWSERRDRVGDWNGWRQNGAAQPAPQAQSPDPYGQGQGQYGGQGYGQPQPPQTDPRYAPQTDPRYAPQPQTYPPQQGQPYPPQGQPYPPQGQPQPYPPQPQPYPAQPAPRRY